MAGGKNDYGVPSDGGSVTEYNPGDMADETAGMDDGDGDDYGPSNGTPAGHADCVPKA